MDNNYSILDIHNSIMDIFLSIIELWISLIELWRGRGALIRRRCLVLVQGRLTGARYRSRHPDRCLRLTHHHRCRCRMLEDRPQNWNHQLWSHA